MVLKLIHPRSLVRSSILCLLFQIFQLEPVSASWLAALFRAGEMTKLGAEVAETGHSANDIFKGVNGGLRFGDSMKKTSSIVNLGKDGKAALPTLRAGSKLKPHELPGFESGGGSHVLTQQPKLAGIPEPIAKPAPLPVKPERVPVKAVSESESIVSALARGENEARTVKLNAIETEYAVQGAHEGFFSTMSAGKIKEAEASLQEFLKKPGSVFMDMRETAKMFKRMRFLAKYSRDPEVRAWADGHVVTKFARAYQKEETIFGHFLTHYLKMNAGWRQADVVRTPEEILAANMAALKNPPDLFTQSVKLTEDVIKGLMALPFIPIAQAARVWEAAKPWRATHYFDWAQKYAQQYIREDIALNLKNPGIAAEVIPESTAAKTLSKNKAMIHPIVWHDTKIAHPVKALNPIGTKFAAQR